MDAGVELRHFFRLFGQLAQPFGLHTAGRLATPTIGERDADPGAAVVHVLDVAPAQQGLRGFILDSTRQHRGLLLSEGEDGPGIEQCLDLLLQRQLALVVFLGVATLLNAFFCHVILFSKQQLYLCHRGCSRCHSSLRLGLSLYIRCPGSTPQSYTR